MPEAQETLARDIRLVQRPLLRGTTSLFESSTRAKGDLGLQMKMLLLNPYAKSEPAFSFFSSSNMTDSLRCIGGYAVCQWPERTNFHYPSYELYVASPTANLPATPFWPECEEESYMGAGLWLSCCRQSQVGQRYPASALQPVLTNDQIHTRQLPLHSQSEGRLSRPRS